jgi:glycine cleavage system H protein
MPTEWKTVRVRQELMVAAKRELETSRYRSLSEFVSEAIQLRLDELKRSREKIAEKQVEYPVIHERLLYTPNHMWAMVTPKGNVRVGLSYYAQEHLKGIAGIRFESVGCKVKEGDSLGVVETWMFMFDICSPVSGKIVRINRVLQEEPSIINKDPYDAGWIAEIKPSNLVTLEEELRGLMRLHQYKTWMTRMSRPRILSI